MSCSSVQLAEETLTTCRASEQESILGAALQHRETLLTATLERARAAGVDIEMEDEEEAYSEDDESE